MYCCHAIVVTSFALYKYLFSPCTKMLEILFRCPFLSFLFLDFPPKICMWRLCLTHVTCRFGPTIIVGLRIQIVKFVNIQHPINHCLTYQILPCTHFSNTTGVFSPCTGKSNISSVLNTCFNSYILRRRLEQRRFKSVSKHSANLFCL